MEHKNKEINNTFIDVIVFIGSIFVSLGLGIIALLGVKKYTGRKSYFYEALDFIFRLWPKSFFTKPSFYKITSFFGELLKYLFKR